MFGFRLGCCLLQFHRHTIDGVGLECVGQHLNQRLLIIRYTECVEQQSRHFGGGKIRVLGWNGGDFLMQSGITPLVKIAILEGLKMTPKILMETIVEQISQPHQPLLSGTFLHFHLRKMTTIQIAVHCLSA